MPIENPQGELTQAIQIFDFSGGITDNFIHGQQNQYREAVNFLLTDNKKLITRPGTSIYDAINPQLPTGNARVSGYLTTKDNFFHVSGRNFFSQISGSWAELTGPSGNPVLSEGSNATQFDQAFWNETYIVTGLDYGSPMKIYPDENGDYQVRNAGLPKLTLYNTISLANEIRAQYNAHVIDALMHNGPGGIDSDNSIVAPNAFSLSSLLELTNELSQKYEAHNADAQLVVPSHHNGTGADNSLSSTVNVLTLTEAQERLNDLKPKYNAHDADAAAHTFFVGYQVAASFVTEPSISGTAGTNSYIYTIVAFYEYVVGTITYRDYGPTFEKLIESVDAPDVNAITISDIAVITNGTNQNYDTANIKWVIYRTESEGTVGYEVGSIANGVTTFVDTTADAGLANALKTVYTTGGILDNDPPPEAKFVVVVNDIAWYANIKEGTELRKNVVRQSVRFDIDSCPASFEFELEDEVVGVGAVNIYPIIFCKSKIFRLEGFVTADGQGFTIQREIARTNGALNHLSIVNIRVPDSGQEGICFAGTDGFYFTDGFNVLKISDTFDERYKGLTTTDTQKAFIAGAYDGINDRVYWACARDAANTDNDGFFVFDADYGVKKDGVFTTIEPGSDSWQPTAIAFDHLGQFAIGDTRGYSFKFEKNKLTDPKINISNPVSDWLTSAIEWDYQSVSMNGGDASIRKWLNLLTLTVENRTNISLLPSYDRENSNNFTEICEIRIRDGITWGDDSVIWQDGTPNQTPVYPWNTFAYIQQKRRFVAQNLRVNYITMRFTNSQTIITNSDTLDTATVVGQDVTLDSAVDWPLDAEDYKIAFEVDGYVTKYPIQAVSGSVITVSGSVPAGATQKWHLIGVHKNEAFNLIDYAIHWQPLTPSFIPYRASSSGANQ